MHPRRSVAMKRLTMRSSSEWYEMTARRPSGRSVSTAPPSATGSVSSSRLTAI